MVKLVPGDPDEMSSYAAFELSLRCFPKYLIASIQID